jgi:hypothetical protein
MASKASLGLVLLTAFLPHFAYAQWQPDGVAVCLATSTQGNPYAASDGAGGAIIAWEDSRNGGGSDIYAQRVDASGYPLWAPDGVAVCTATSVQTYARVVSDAAGGAIISWVDLRSGVSAAYVQRLDPSGLPQWTTDGVLLGQPAGESTIASDGAGGAIVAWQRLVVNPINDIYAQRVDAAGAPLWSAGGVPVCTASGDQQDPVLASDGAGGAIITWWDARVTALRQIYAQRVDAGGLPQWTADGVALCVQYSLFPRIAADGFGGAVVAWEDSRTGPTTDIYAQRVDAGGTPLWTADGVALCTAVNNQTQPVVASDGSGGAVVAWRDLRLVSNNIYAQRVNSAGTAQWMVNGVALCTAGGEQAYPEILSDGAGGAIVAWHDQRIPANYDIYAQYVSGGSVQWAADGVALCAASGAQTYPKMVAGAGGPVVVWQDQRNGGSDIYAANVSVATAAPDLPPAGAPSIRVWPNPFASSASVAFHLTRDDHVQLSVHDVAGRLLRVLADGDLAAGAVEATWDGRDASGARLASGVYFVRFASQGSARSARVVLRR